MAGLVPRRQPADKRRMGEGQFARIWQDRAVAAGAAVLAFALPPRCPGCGEVTPEDHRFCPACWMQLDFLVGPACATCGDPFEIDAGPDIRCGACLKDAPVLDGVQAAVAYGDIARTIAVRLKHGRRPGLAETIARQLERLAPPDDTIVAPVPLHRWRIWSRGFNQSALIARALARRRGLRVTLDLVERRRHTPMLRGLGRSARAKAVRGAFVIPAVHRPALAGASVLLIDDVFTTGATANACARALKQAGAAEVRLLCWARVLRGTSQSLDI